MTFSYTVEDLTNESGDGTESFTFTLKDAGDIPVGMLRRNRRNQDGLMWDTFEWATPLDQVEAFDRLTIMQVLRMFNDWQEAPLESKKVDQDKPVGPPPTPKSKKAAAAKPEPDTDE